MTDDLQFHFLHVMNQDSTMSYFHSQDNGKLSIYAENSPFFNEMVVVTKKSKLQGKES